MYKHPVHVFQFEHTDRSKDSLTVCFTLVITPINLSASIVVGTCIFDHLQHLLNIIQRLSIMSLSGVMCVTGLCVCLGLHIFYLFDM